MNARPPAALRRLLAWILPAGPVREGLLGDLDELYADRFARGRLSADLWYTRQVLSATCRYSIRRCRREEGWRMETVRSDLVGALRALRRAPGFYGGAAILMALGVGAVTATFAVVDHLFFRPLPYPHAERLVKVEGSQSYPAFLDLAEIRSVETWAAASVDDAHLTGVGDPLRISQARVTGSFFDVFGAGAQLGRLLSSEEPDADVVVLSDGAWQRIFGASRDVLGRSVQIDGAPVAVVGVASPSFVPPEALLDGAVPDLWRPVDRAHPDAEDRASRSLVIAGRLVAGTTPDRARAEADELAQRRASAFPDLYVRRDGSIVELPVTDLHEATVGSARERLRLLVAAVVLLLVVSCVNVAHLFIARGVTRHRELAIHRALGASTLRVARRAVFESLLVALTGAVLGVGLADLALRMFATLDPVSLPRATDIGIDLRVLAFATAVATATALCFGLLPAFRGARADPALALRSGGRSGTGHGRERWTRELLVTAEVAMSFVLVFYASLLTRSFLRMDAEPLGFRVADVWTVRIGLRDGADGLHWRDRMERIAGALRSAPGVRSVTYGLSAPLEHVGGTCCWSRPVSRRGGPATDGAVEAAVHPYDPDWVDVLEPRILAGASWNAVGLQSAAPPAVLNERLATQLFGSVEEAVGKAIDLGPSGHEVVGVVPETRHYGPSREHGPAVYVPAHSVPFTPDRLTLIVRAQPGLDDVARRLREGVWQVEPLLPLPTVRSMEEWTRGATAKARFDGWFYGIFAGAALLLAAAGIGGTLMYMVRVDTRALGIRLALGASRRSVEASMLRRALGTTAAGLLIGTLLALMMRPVLEARLFGIASTDPTTLLAAAAVLLSTATVAAWLPAHRAGAVDPVDTLRRE